MGSNSLSVWVSMRASSGLFGIELGCAFMFIGSSWQSICKWRVLEGSRAERPDVLVRNGALAWNIIIFQLKFDN